MEWILKPVCPLESQEVLTGSGKAGEPWWAVSLQERGWSGHFPSLPTLSCLGHGWVFANRPEMLCENCQMWAQVQGTAGGAPETHTVCISLREGRLSLTLKTVMRTGDGERSLLVLWPFSQLASQCSGLFLKAKHLVPQSGSLPSC